MLVSKELVHQDLRGVQLRALEEECKKAARIALDNYNQAMVQYTHVVHTQMDTQMHAHTTQAPPDVDVHNRILWGFEL